MKLTAIRIDGGTQLRAETNQETIFSYAQDMLAGDVFPPVVVFHDGTDTWLSDGFHRYKAAEQAGYDEIEVDVRQGTQRDALLHAAEANRKHGIQLTNKDKRRIVTMFLHDAEWAKWSDREIARRCGVSQPFVSKLREELTDNGYQPDIRRGGDGRIYNVANIGSSEKGVDAWWKTIEENAPEERVEAIRYYAQIHNSVLTMQNEAAEAAIREARRIGQLLNEMKAHEKARPLDLDTEAREIRALLDLEQTTKNPLLTVAIGRKLLRVKNHFDMTGMIDQHLSTFVQDAIAIGQILREVQGVLTPEQFISWLRAENGGQYDGDEEYIHALISATQPYTKETPIDAIDLDTQRLIAIAWYNWAISSGLVERVSKAHDD